MDQGELFEKAMRRPKWYNSLKSQAQWRIDKDLGILDWDGSCPHSEGTPCKECEKRYLNR